MSYEQRHSHEAVERLAATLAQNEKREADTELLLRRIADLVAEVAQEAAASRVVEVCAWLRGTVAQENTDGADVLKLSANETLAEAIERRFGGES
jgi:predicted NBD/HSP70 family sugar kinase